MYEEMLGPLRGKAPPSEETLRRLHDLNPRYRVTWTPATARRTAHWSLHEVMVGPTDALRRLASDNRLARLAKLPREQAEDRKAEVWQAEEMRLGFYFVGEYREDEFGTDRMFSELRRGEALLREEQRQLALAAAREQEGRQDVSDEMDVDPTFRQHVRDVAMDFYASVAGAETVGWTPALDQGASL